jgi:ABC-type multidrug transport system permease subunit
VTTPAWAPARPGSLLRLVSLGSILSYRALFFWTVPSLFVGTLLVGPLMQLFFFVNLGRSLGVADDSFYIFGNAIVAASVPGVFGGAMAVANERRYGTLESVLLSNRQRGAIFISRGIPYALTGLIVSTVVLVVAALVLGLRVGAAALPSIVGALLAASAASTAFGLVLGAVGLRLREMWLITNIWAALLLLLTRTNVPSADLPGWMLPVGDLLPITHAADAARGAAAGLPASEVGQALALELSVGAGYAVLALLLLRLFEWEGRRTASFTTV